MISIKIIKTLTMASVMLMGLGLLSQTAQAISVNFSFFDRHSLIQLPPFFM